jgi:hypothetical protein
MQGEAMCEFIMEIAGRRVSVTCTFDKTRDFCREYLAEDGPVDFSVEVLREDVYAELDKSRLEAEVEGIPFVKFSAYDYEQSALYRKLAEQLLAFDTLLFHGSAISVDGEAYLFTATSGTGKSTHTSFWRQTFGQRAVMVNDDKPLLRMIDGKVYVCGTPWNGKHGLGTKITVPLKGLCILERAEENSIRPVTLPEVLPLLMQQSFRPRNPASVHRVLELLSKLSESTGLYRLGCNLDPQAAMVAYQGMNRKDNEV